MKNRALILVDYQNEWINEHSEYYVGDIQEVIDKTNKLLEFCRKENYKIIFTRHIELGASEQFAEDSKNSEIMSEINKKDRDTIIVKHKISPFYKTNLEEELRGIDEIVVSGILTNLCVRSLVQDAYDRDFAISLIQDCCAAFEVEVHKFTCQDLKATREEILILDLEELID